MRIVRILQLISAISLTSAFVIFTFGIIQWVRGRPESELNPGHSIVEEFKQRRSEGKNGFQQTASPLVAQAKAFASYLDPPKPTKPVQAKVSKPNGKRRITSVDLPKITPKFTLLATSYYRSMPEESLALVSEPGREPRWIKQGDRLGHFTLAKIERGTIVYQDGDQMGEMAINTKVPTHIEETPQRTLASSEPKPSRPKPSEHTQRKAIMKNTNQTTLASNNPKPSRQKPSELPQQEKITTHTKVPTHTEEVSQTRLASDKPEPSRPKASDLNKPKKTNTRRSKHMLGPSRQAIHVMAYSQKTTEN